MERRAQGEAERRPTLRRFLLRAEWAEQAVLDHGAPSAGAGGGLDRCLYETIARLQCLNLKTMGGMIILGN